MYKAWNICVYCVCVNGFGLINYSTNIWHPKYVRLCNQKKIRRAFFCRVKVFFCFFRRFMSVVGGGCQLCLINFVLHASFYWLDRWDSTRSCVAHINKTLQQLWQHLMAFNDYTVVGWDLLSVFLSSYGKAEHRLYAFHPFLCSTCLVPRHSHEPKHTNCKPNIRQFSVNVYFITSLAFIYNGKSYSLAQKKIVYHRRRSRFFFSPKILTVSTNVCGMISPPIKLPCTSTC